MGELTTRVEQVLAGLQGGRAAAVGAVVEPDRTAGGWVQLLEQLRLVKSAAEAMEYVAVARLAGTDSELTEDGVVVEVDRGVGHVRLDASDLTAGALGVAPRFAESKVVEAVHLATHLPAVGDWLAEGRVTDYGVRTLVEQTLTLDPEQCGRVVGDLGPWVHDASGRRGGRVVSGSAVRTRVKASIVKTCPESLVPQSEQVFGDRCLTRLHDRVGGQRWEAVLPNGEADLAYDAIDKVARGLKRDGSAATLDQARADAMVQLVLANVTTRVVLNVATPVVGSVVRTVVESGSESAVGSVAEPAAGSVAEPAARLVAEPAAGSVTRSTAQGVSRSAVVDGTRTTSAGPVVSADTGGPTGAELPAIVGVMGLGSGMVEVTRDWLAEVAGRATTLHRQVAVDPVTGWLATPPAGGDAHDPPAALQRWVVARDGTCRFPGCDIKASRCDLDHVIPWEPLQDNGSQRGRTTAHNLLCLCRHHHRVKQRPDWTVVLHPDGVAVWTNPTGRDHATTPVDHREVGTRPAALEPYHLELHDLDPDPDTSGSPLERAHACRLRRLAREHRRVDLAQARRAHYDSGVLDECGRPRTTRGLPLADRHGIVHGDGTDHPVTGRRSQSGVRRQREVVVEIGWDPAPRTRSRPEPDRFGDDPPF